MNKNNRDITAILGRWRDGDPEALDELAPLVVRDLRALAISNLHGPEGHGIQATDLVNDFFAVVSDKNKTPLQPWQSRRQFFAFAGKAMRNLLVNELRRQKAHKRGGDQLRVSLDEVLNADYDSNEIIRIGEAVADLERVDRLQGRIVDLVFFVGLTQEEAADALEVSVFKLRREWKTAKLWLREALTQG